MLWFDDGQTKMAVAVPERGYRFFAKGIAQRCNSLCDRYLRGLIEVRHGDVVVNFGSNIGEVAVALAAKGAHVIAIEPDPYVLQALNANAERYGLTVISAAAWKEDGELAINLATDFGDTSVFEPKPNRAIGRALVQGIRIDTLIKELGLKRIRLIVGDAEGAEPEVLEGARETLAITDYVSVSASAERNGESTGPMCEQILSDAGFEIVHREETGFQTLIGMNKG